MTRLLQESAPNVGISLPLHEEPWEGISVARKNAEPMDKVFEEIDRLRDQQKDDFKLIMGALADQRDAMERMEQAFTKYTTRTDQILDRLQTAVITSRLETDARVQRLEERMDAWEQRHPPAA